MLYKTFQRMSRLATFLLYFAIDVSLAWRAARPLRARAKTDDHVALGHGRLDCCLDFLLRAFLVFLPVALRRDGVSHVSIPG